MCPLSDTNGSLPDSSIPVSFVRLHAGEATHGEMAGEQALIAGRDLLFMVKKSFPELNRVASLESIPYDIERYRQYLDSKDASENRRLLIRASESMTGEAGPFYGLIALCPHYTPNSLQDVGQPDGLLNLMKALHMKQITKQNYAMLFRLLRLYRFRYLPPDFYRLLNQQMSVVLLRQTGENHDFNSLLRYATAILQNEIMALSYSKPHPILQVLQSMKRQECDLPVQRACATLRCAYKVRQGLLLKLYENAFASLRSNEVTLLLRRFILTIDPSKRYTHPYKSGEEARPDWWPLEFEHKEAYEFPIDERRRLLITIAGITEIHYIHAEINTPDQLQSDAGSYARSVLKEFFKMLKVVSRG